MSYDIKIVGGTVIDGTGKPGYRGDVGIKDGKVVALGKAEGEARTTIDATGKVVAPGFVDIHTHYDAQILWDRMMTISPWHGVTTAVIGNCGFGVAPTLPRHRRLILQTLEKVEGMSLEALESGLGKEWPFETFPQYMDAIEKRGTAINVGVLIGHTPLRLYAMGEDSVERAATPEEVARMRTLVREGMEAGAIGFATSKSITHVGYAGKPVPSRQAEIAEIEALAAEAGARGGVMQVTIGKDFFIDEMNAMSRKLGMTISWTALLAGLAGPGSHRRYLDRTAEGLREGANVVPQVSCRPLNFEFNFADPFPFETLKLFNELGAADAATPGTRAKAYADPAFRRRFTESLLPILRGWWDRTVIAYAPGATELEERNLGMAARELGKDPVDLALDLALASNLTARFRIAMLNFVEDEVAELLADDTVVLGLSDAGAHASQLCDACFSTSLLRHWVREKKAVSLERAVHMLTGRPAEVFGIKDRGRLAEGWPADVVVFDPATVGDGPLRRVHDLPGGADRLVSEASGIEAVVVNGTLLRRQGKDMIESTGPLPGRMLRGGRAA